ADAAGRRALVGKPVVVVDERNGASPGGRAGNRAFNRRVALPQLRAVRDELRHAEVRVLRADGEPLPVAGDVDAVASARDERAVATDVPRRADARLEGVVLVAAIVVDELFDPFELRIAQ